MGAYDDIGWPVKGQPISSGAYGIKVRNAIIDLDRRVSAYDTSTGTGKAFSTSNLVLATASVETQALLITGMVFKAGLAYEATCRFGVASAFANTLVNTALRKYNATPSSGTPYGEYFRFAGPPAAGTSTAMSSIGSIYLLNNTAVDVTNDVMLTVNSSASGTNAAIIFATTNSPRYLVIKPAGFASDFAGMGVQVV